MIVVGIFNLCVTWTGLPSGSMWDLCGLKSCVRIRAVCVGRRWASQTFSMLSKRLRLPKNRCGFIVRANKEARKTKTSFPPMFPPKAERLPTTDTDRTASYKTLSALMGAQFAATLVFQVSAIVWLRAPLALGLLMKN